MLRRIGLKTKWSRGGSFLAFFGLAAAAVQAQIVVISDYGSVSVSGTAAGVDGKQSFSDSKDSATAPFTLNASGSANWTDTTLSYDNLGVPKPISASASATASQTLGITSASISAGGQLSAADGFNRVFQVPGQSASATAQSSFATTFLVQSAIEFSLSVADSSFNSDPGPSGWKYSLKSSSGSDVLSELSPSFSQGPGGLATLEYDGTLEPGTYTLSMLGLEVAIVDPLGDSGNGSYDMKLDVSGGPLIVSNDSVPDGFPTIVPLALLGAFFHAARQRLKVTPKRRVI